MSSPSVSTSADGRRPIVYLSARNSTVETTPVHSDRGADRPELGHHLAGEIVGASLGDRRGVVDPALPAERGVGDDAGADRADDAADAVDAEHVQRVVILERVLHRGDEHEAHARRDRAEQDRGAGMARSPPPG